MRLTDFHAKYFASELTRRHSADSMEKLAVRETKGTRDVLMLRSDEADKIRCGQRHFEALNVDFKVAVSADEV